MPRRGRSSRSRGSSFGSRRSMSTTTASKPKAKRPPPPAQSRTAPAPAQSQGGSMVGGLGSMLMQGMAWGAASSVGHRAVDAVMGPRSVNVEHSHPESKGETKQAPQQNSEGFNCSFELGQFNQCVQKNSGDIGACQFYFDAMNQCNQTLKDNQKWN